jgi:hypothetical protein
MLKLNLLVGARAKEQFYAIKARHLLMGNQQVVNKAKYFK